MKRRNTKKNNKHTKKNNLYTKRPTKKRLYKTRKMRGGTKGFMPFFSTPTPAKATRSYIDKIIPLNIDTLNDLIYKKFNINDLANYHTFIESICNVLVKANVSGTADKLAKLIEIVETAAKKEKETAAKNQTEDTEPDNQDLEWLIGLLNKTRDQMKVTNEVANPLATPGGATATAVNDENSNPTADPLATPGRGATATAVRGATAATATPGGATAALPDAAAPGQVHTLANVINVRTAAQAAAQATSKGTLLASRK